ncbi:MAG TPA: MmcQ/YjbR family DNA-binding protein [Thermoanaerobaculia bacterium]|nr:MmcQ/YjbR family DNA-binding protein [Thermoanaerobaculia bacterium]
MAVKKAKARKFDPEAFKEELRQHALRYPEVHEDYPWGELAIKVKGKAFIFMRAEADTVSLSVKLPQSRDMANDLPFAEPTHYGLGKHGWVTAKITAKEAGETLEMLKAWIDESFRAVAPKSIVKKLTAPALG